MKKLGIILAVSVFVICMILSVSDPIVLAIRDECDCDRDGDGVYSFYYDEEKKERYYLKNGSCPLDVTVYYLFAEPEMLCDAMIEGHITATDLDRFDVEYMVVPSYE